MMQLFYNPSTKKLLASDAALPNYQLVMRPFSEEDRVRNKDFSCEIIIPDTSFSFRINTRYNKSSFGTLRMYDNGKELIKMTQLMHVTHVRKLSTIDKMSEILVSLSSEDNVKEWRKVFRIITNTFNNLTTWQPNEALIMIDELKKLMAEEECYELTWDETAPKPTPYTGIELTILKAQKLMEAIKMLKVTEMENLVGIKDEINSLCIYLLPILKSCYLSELNNNAQLITDVNEALLQMEHSEDACKHREEYVDFMLKNGHSSTKENAEARFSKKYPNEAALVDSNTDIVNYYSEKNTQWQKIRRYRSTIEEAMSTIFQFLNENGNLDRFLNAI